jgi:hypothetical protein
MKISIFFRDKIFLGGDRGTIIDFFWYEPQWNPPDQSMLQEGDQCVYFGINEGFCILYYKDIGANENHILHPSHGVFAAGNELVPPEIEPIK